MKFFQHNPGKLLIAVIAGSLVASATAQAGASRSGSFRDGAEFGGNARIIVRRAADFGTIRYLHLYIDGVPVTTLGLNEGFEAIVRPGRHIFSSATSPGSYTRSQVMHRRVTLRPGQTYAFTALWEGPDHVVLETSDPANARRAFSR